MNADAAQLDLAEGEARDAAELVPVRRIALLVDVVVELVGRREGIRQRIYRGRQILGRQEARDDGEPILVKGHLGAFERRLSNAHLFDAMPLRKRLLSAQ